MADDAPSDEKSYKDWLAEALARDQETWEKLEEKLKKIKATGPRPAPRPTRPLDW
jgi:hypothetical protein